MADGEPDNGVGDNPDLGRLFSLLVRGQQNTARVMGEMRDAAVRSLHMAQSFMTGQGSQGAYQARQAMGGGFGVRANPQAGQTTAQNLHGNQNNQQVYNITSVPPSGGNPPPQNGSGGAGGSSSSTTGPAGPPAGSTTSTGPSWTSWRPTLPSWNLPPVGQVTAAFLQNHTRMPTSGAGWAATLGQLRDDTIQQTQQRWSRAALGVWSPYWGQGGSGGSGGAGGGGNNNNGGGGGGGGGGGFGPGPYGMGPAGLPPNPIYFGGPGSPHGPYGPYGPYGSGGGGGGHGGTNGSGFYGANHTAGGGNGGHLWGMNSGIGGWMRRNIPGVGLVDKAFGEVKSQRNKNEYYQNIEGGGNFSGFGERAHEEAYVASTTAFLSDDEARQAFKGVTRLGYNGRVRDQYSRQGGRQNALDFIYHGKSSYGASVSESLQQLEVVSKNSTLSLNGLQKALKDVSDTAGRAGVNAQMARKQLMDMVSTGVQAGYGAGAVPTATNIQMGKTSLGRSYEDIDLSGQMGQQYAYMASSNAGMTYNQYTAMQTTNPLAASQARAGENLSLLSQIFTQDEINWVKQKANSMGGQLDSDSALAVVPEFMQTFPNHNISVIQQQLAAFGIVQTDDPQKAVAYAFTLIAGQNGDLANAQKNAKANKPMSTKAAGKQGKDSGFIQGFSTKVDHGSSAAAGITGAFVKASTFGIVDGIGTDKGDSKAMQEYKSRVKGSGQRNPVIENLLQHVSDQDSAKVVVHTSKGQRVVSLKDAIKDHSAELASGTARFVDGKEKGRSVQDILGVGSIDTTANWTQEAAKAKGSEGESIKAWEKDHPSRKTSANSGGTAANGRVVVDLTDTAKQLLKVSSATGVAGANGEGAPPLNFYNWNASR